VSALRERGINLMEKGGGVSWKEGKEKTAAKKGVAQMSLRTDYVPDSRVFNKTGKRSFSAGGRKKMTHVYVRESELVWEREQRPLRREEDTERENQRP